MAAKTYDHPDVAKMIEEWPDIQKQQTEDQQKKQERERQECSAARLKKIRQPLQGGIRLKKSRL
jgi:hypothetical protein